MKTSDFYYDLPQELIAQDPLEDRSSSRLLHLSMKDGSVEHRHFTDILDYLKENRAIVTQFVKDRQWVQGCEPEGTYFYWLRFSGVPDIYERLIKEAHVALNKGTDFHPDAEEYVRLNFACPKKILNEALLRIDRMMQERRTI